MFDAKSDFALNRFDQNAIVCRSVTSVHIRLTCEDFASEEEFFRWKVWSDGDYYCRTAGALWLCSPSGLGNSA